MSSRSEFVVMSMEGFLSSRSEFVVLSMKGLTLVFQIYGGFDNCIPDLSLSSYL